MTHTGVQQGCSSSSDLFDIFIDGIIDYINEGNAYSSVVQKQTIPGILFADDLAVGSFAINSAACGI